MSFISVYRAKFPPLAHHGSLVFVGNSSSGWWTGVITTEERYRHGEPPLAIITLSGDVRENTGFDLPLIGTTSELEIGEDIISSCVPTDEAVRRLFNDVH